MKGTLFLMVLAVVAATLPVVAGDGSTVFVDIAEHYEAIRQALIRDSTDGVTANARSIRAAAAALQMNFSADQAAVAAAEAAMVRELLPEVEERAADLAAASGLQDARSAFAELTKPLVRWQSVVTGDRPVVVYCPMEKKSWLQPDEPVGNPYAPSMLRCGEIVSR